MPFGLCWVRGWSEQSVSEPRDVLWAQHRGWDELAPAPCSPCLPLAALPVPSLQQQDPAPRHQTLLLLPFCKIMNLGLLSGVGPKEKPQSLAETGSN